MHPAGPSSKTTLPRRSDNSGSNAPVDPYEHQLSMAQLEAEAAAIERLSRARHDELEAGHVRVSPGQLRLVVNE